MTEFELTRYQDTETIQHVLHNTKTVAVVVQQRWKRPSSVRKKWLLRQKLLRQP